jgi:hypothetical protein
MFFEFIFRFFFFKKDFNLGILHYIDMRLNFLVYYNMGVYIMDKVYEKFIERLRAVNSKIAEVKEALKTFDSKTVRSWRSVLSKMDEDFRQTKNLIQRVHNDGLYFRTEDELKADLALKNLETETKYAFNKLLALWGEQNYYVY